MKKFNRLLIYVPTFLAIIGLTFSCKPKLQEEKDALSGQKFKMTTKIPDGIAIPDKVESRIGTLNFFDGFPDSATVEKLYDNLDFQRAVQAYLLGLAPVSQYANRKGILECGPENLTVPIFEDIMNARSLFLTLTIILLTLGFGLI